jgi:hypothetical protein
LNIGSLIDSLNDVKSILKSVDVYKKSNTSRKMDLSPNKFSEEFIKVSQTEDYDLIFKTAMKHSDYDFLLIDDSLFQFSCKLNENGGLVKGVIRYAFYENPRVYPTYEEFLYHLGIPHEECGDAFMKDYEQEIDEARLKDSVTPIRYDYDYRLYEPIHHPISHIHIGHNNEIRIPCDKILTPAKFVNFVLSNFHRKQWKKSYQHEQFKDLALSIKRSCYPIESDTFTREEKELLYMS